MAVTKLGVNMRKYITILLIIITLKGYAQPELEDGDGTVPVDGGISILLALGSTYAIRKVSQSALKK